LVNFPFLLITEAAFVVQILQ